MKKSVLVLTTLLALGVPGVAVADEATDALEATIAQLREDVEARDLQLKHKSDVLACERAKRRALEKGLRTGAPVVSASPCR